MKLTPLFSLVVGFHLMVVAGLFVFPGCQSSPDATDNSKHTEVGRQESVSQPTISNVQTQPDKSNNTYGRRYPPTRPTWNLSNSDKAEVIDGYNAYSNEQAPLNPELIEPVERVERIERVEVTVIKAPESSVNNSMIVRTYVIKKGDSLSRIARRQQVSVARLMQANGLNKNSILQIGQVLKLPDGSEVNTVGYSVSKPAASTQVRLSGESTYTIQPGDTLSGIAQRHGLMVSNLRNANRMQNDRIFAGKVIVIPEATAVPVHQAPVVAGEAPQDDEGTYTVKPGDTLGTIAKRYKVSVRELAQRNNISDPRKMRVGRLLVIPPDGIAPSNKSLVSAPQGVVRNNVRLNEVPAPMAIIDERNVPTVEVVEENNSFDDLDSIPVVPVNTQEAN